MLREKDMDNTSVIVTGGPTRSYLDNVRYITNSSSGKTGIELAKNAHIRGAKTNLVLGPTKIGVPRKINTTRISTSQEMVNEVMQLLEAEPQSMVILSAAMADFKVKEKVEGKIKSGNDLTLELQSTIKLSDMIKEKYPKSKLVLFKAEWNVSRDELIESAKNKLAHCNADFIVANDLSEEDAGFETNTNRVIVIDKAGSITELFSSKLELSEELFNIFSS
jgi:phosphopantothenoylcysteine decarboxylase/phosphopantothenate--cysteine ligase